MKRPILLFDELLHIKSNQMAVFPSKSWKTVFVLRVAGSVTQPGGPSSEKFACGLCGFSSEAPASSQSACQADTWKLSTCVSVSGCWSPHHLGGPEWKMIGCREVFSRFKEQVGADAEAKSQGGLGSMRGIWLGLCSSISPRGLTGGHTYLVMLSAPTGSDIITCSALHSK